MLETGVGRIRFHSCAHFATEISTTHIRLPRSPLRSRNTGVQINSVDHPTNDDNVVSLAFFCLINAQRMPEEYVRNEWKSPEELHWVGKYAADAHKIFVEQKWREAQPNDHALNWWVEWMRGTQSRVDGTPERSFVSQ